MLVWYFCGRVPTPKESFAVDRCFQEVRQGVKNLAGSFNRGGYDLDVVVHAVNGARPGEMPDSGAAVAVFGVAGIEPHVQCKRLVLWVGT